MSAVTRIIFSDAAGLATLLVLLRLLYICSTKYSDKRKFVTGAAYCCKCNALLCEVCRMEKGRAAFTEGQLTHRWGRSICLRCKRCHVCTRCGKTKVPTKFTGNGKECTQCVNAIRLHKCAICEIDQEEKYFLATNSKHAKRDGAC